MPGMAHSGVSFVPVHNGYKSLSVMGGVNGAIIVRDICFPLGIGVSNPNKLICFVPMLDLKNQFMTKQNE